MSRYIFDIETDNLLRKCSRCWIVAAMDIDTQEQFYWLEGDLGWQKVFNEAHLLAGHNILGFDLMALKKLFNWEPNKSTAIHDTLLLSQILDYDRFPGSRHGLESWGDYLNFPKGDFSDFSAYSEEMLEYCLQDVRLNFKVYKQLLSELQLAVKKNERVKHYIRAHHLATACSALI